jgi:hypothetical protein
LPLFYPTRSADSALIDNAEKKKSANEEISVLQTINFYAPRENPRMRTFDRKFDDRKMHSSDNVSVNHFSVTSKDGEIWLRPKSAPISLFLRVVNPNWPKGFANYSG